MGERTKYTPGTFSWADVSTTDQPAAKAFYSGLFGWEADDRPMGDGVVYSMMLKDGHEVAAVSPQPQMQREAGVPPVWNNYVTVESADASADKASQLGATVHAPPFDVMDAGRMAVIQDPQGAFFMVWEPRESIGAGLVNAPGALAWNELASPDLDASAKFYGDLFGWTTRPLEGSPQPYLIIMNGERSNGGIRELGDEPVASLEAIVTVGGCSFSDSAISGWSPIPSQLGIRTSTGRPESVGYALRGALATG